HALVIGGIKHDGVQSQSPVAGHPSRPMRMIEQTTDERPGLTSITGLKERSRFYSAIEHFGFVHRAERYLPDVFEGYSGIGRKSNRRFLRIRPAFSKVIAGTKKRSPIILS